MANFFVLCTVLVLALTIDTISARNIPDQKDLNQLADELKHKMVREVVNLLLSSLGRNRQHQGGGGREAVVYPGQSMDYEWMDLNRGQNEEATPVFPGPEAAKRRANPRDYIKKSFTDNKQIRFHQCYFNPISCFR